MAKLTRRGLIKSVGADGELSAAVATGVHFGSAALASTHTTALPVGASNEALVVYVSNPATGTLVLMRGEHEITVRSPALVRSLLSL
jgi:hypothetical protein